MTTQNQQIVHQHEEQPEHVRAERRITPPVDVFENKDEIVVLVDVPGVEQDGFDIRLHDGTLELEARQPKDAATDLGFQPLVYARSFTVPRSVDAENVAAALDKGVLRIQLPKSEAAKPRRIAVSAG